MSRKILSIIIAIGYFCLFFVFQIVVTVPVMIIKGFSVINDADMLSFITVLSNLLSIICFMLITKLRKQKISEEYYLYKAPVPKLFLIIPAGILLNIFVSFILEFLSENVPFINKCMIDYEEQASVMNNMSPAVYIIFAVILAPVMEELIFRGGIYRVVKSECSFVTAAMVSSLFFGIAHGNLVWSTYAFLLGVLLCSVYEKYHSIAVNIMLHLSFNLTSTFIEKVFSNGDTLQGRDFIVGTASGVISVIILIILFIGKTENKEQNAVLP